MGSRKKTKELGKPEDPVINTILQLKIMKSILKLTDMKEPYGGWIFRTEVVNTIQVKYNTLQDFLEKEGIELIMQKTGALAENRMELQSEDSGILHLTC